MFVLQPQLWRGGDRFLGLAPQQNSKTGKLRPERDLRQIERGLGSGAQGRPLAFTYVYTHVHVHTQTYIHHTHRTRNKLLQEYTINCFHAFSSPPGDELLELSKIAMI